jgi:hypothetical protein
MAQQLLDCSDVLPPLQKVRREQWRKVWEVARFVRPDAATASRTAF